MTDPPPCRMLLRSKDGLELFTVAEKNGVNGEKQDTERHFLLKGPTTLQKFAPDGSRVYVQRPNVGVVMCLLNTENNENGDGNHSSSEAHLKDSQGVQMLHVSPKGSYLLTWERLSSADPTKPNLKIWSALSGEYLHGFIQKNLRKEGWPYVQWTFDESFAFHMVTNEIRVYDGNAFGAEEVRFRDKLRIPGISSMSVPQMCTTDTAATPLLASFCPKTKDKPARASLHRYDPSKEAQIKEPVFPSIVSKSLFNAEEVTVYWAPRGDAALMALESSVDTSGESYYGSTTLFLMTESASDTIHVPLPQSSSSKSQGPVLSVAWMPNPNKPPCFAVVSGRMPSLASLHQGTTGEAQFSFGNAHRNTIAWAPHGRFVCLAGFGNLQGGMTFWDRNKLKVIPQYDVPTGVPLFPEIRANCTVGYGWSPDSRLFLSSTTSPRMNVDNGVRVFRYNGEERTDLPWDNANYRPDKLLEASFVPSPKANYPDRPQSPAPRITGDAAAIAEAKKRAKEANSKPGSSPAVKRYVPPSARGRTGTGTSLAERLRKEKEGAMMGASKINSSTGKPMGKKLPTGMSHHSSSKSKNAHRRERQKQNKAKAEEQRKKQQEAEGAQAAQQELDPEKRARKLKKILKQISELKAKDPATLNEDQKKKIASEESLLAELKEVEP